MLGRVPALLTSMRRQDGGPNHERRLLQDPEQFRAESIRMPLRAYGMPR
jgi:hypothetical protein